ncbi:hypothetical protein I7I53_02827 [Histoplasma capsulatum var. duboisii H88]|uniref:Uncharacterized protein n=1 Tax=Ajellomyces capsulatus (strain H88) TaxID=544711 RepID=A0A8A1LM63_AJEC8|nr:hypothetical protein I7I53_02827 [Histoplasma capsulatum var. duboisii H88]
MWQLVQVMRHWLIWEQTIYATLLLFLLAPRSDTFHCFSLPEIRWKHHVTFSQRVDVRSSSTAWNARGK